MLISGERLESVEYGSDICFFRPPVPDESIREVFQVDLFGLQDFIHREGSGLIDGPADGLKSGMESE